MAIPVNGGAINVAGTVAGGQLKLDFSQLLISQTPTNAIGGTGYRLQLYNESGVGWLGSFENSAQGFALPSGRWAWPRIPAGSGMCTLTAQYVLGNAMVNTLFAFVADEDTDIDDDLGVLGNSPVGISGGPVGTAVQATWLGSPAPNEYMTVLFVGVVSAPSHMILESATFPAGGLDVQADVFDGTTMRRRTIVNDDATITADNLTLFTFDTIGSGPILIRMTTPQVPGNSYDVYFRTWDGAAIHSALMVDHTGIRYTDRVGNTLTQQGAIGTLRGGAETGWTDNTNVVSLMSSNSGATVPGVLLRYNCYLDSGGTERFDNGASGQAWQFNINNGGLRKRSSSNVPTTGVAVVWNAWVAM